MSFTRPLLAVCALVLAAPWHLPQADERPLARRLAGPISGMWAAGHWVRFDMQVHQNQMERAYLSANRALQLDPWPPAGWIRLAEHLWFIRASAEREPNPVSRTRWFAAGLEVLNEGIERSAIPGEVALVKARMCGLFLLPLVQGGAVQWPGGAAAVEKISREAFGIAQDFGFMPDADLLGSSKPHGHTH